MLAVEQARGINKGTPIVTKIDKASAPSRFEDRSIDLDGASLMITGGTGSFGRKLARVLLDRYRPRRVVVYSRDEAKQVDMAQDFAALPNSAALRFFIGDVRDQPRLKLAMRDIDHVIHAAALKHVPVAEYNPMECVHTNILGAENVVYAALENRVKKVIALSTDKAVNPINLYGATKLASDKVFVAANNLSGRIGTQFSVVRYGNVVGSRGSVVPLFQKLLREGAESLPITDERMTRFWITLDLAVRFVLDTFKIMRGGEIFVPKLPSMRIVDLAEAIAPGCVHEKVGIRPGEKIHEVMIPVDEARNTIEFAKHYVITPQFEWWSDDYRKIPAGGKNVPDDFVYASDMNDKWLSVEEMRQLIGDES